MRLFLGVEIPESAKKTIRDSMVQIRDDYPEFSWIPEANYHLTVFFFGERSEERLNDVIAGIEQTLFDVNTSVLNIFGIKIFVKKGITINVVFDRNKTLELIHNRIITEVGKQVPQKHDRYTPHTKIAEYKLPSKQQYFHLKKKLEKIKIDADFPLNTIHLYQSIEKKPSPEYRILHTFQLQQA